VYYHFLMSKPIALSPAFLKFDFLEYYKRNPSARYIHRCLACHYLQSGKGYQEVSSLLKFHKNSLLGWVKRFESGGIELLLAIRPGRGRKAKIPTLESPAFVDQVLALQKERPGGKVTGKEILAMIKAEYNVTYAHSSIYPLLERMGLSWVSARSQPPKADVEAQAAFKKTLENP
jgi:transposase